MTNATDRLHEFYLSQLRHLEERIEDQDRRITEELADIETRLNAHCEETRRASMIMTTSLQRILDQQAKHEPALTNIEHVMTTGSVLKWVVIFAVATMAGINTIATGIEIIRDWFK